MMPSERRTVIRPGMRNQPDVGVLRADRMADVAEQTVNRVNGILALIERDRSADKCVG